MKYGIGLDLGINNVGYAIYDIENNKILKKGVRLYTPSSSAQDRRSYRASRRLRKRGVVRINEIKNLFLEIGFPINNIIDSKMIETRCKGLKEKLDKQDIVNIIFYFCLNRGYIPFDENDKDEIKKVELNGKYPCEYYKEMLDNFNKYHGLNEVVTNKDNLREIKDMLLKQREYYKEINFDVIERICEIISRKRKFWEGPGGGENNTITPYGRFKNESDVDSYIQKKKLNSNYEVYLFEELIGNCSIDFNQKCAPIINYYSEYFNALNTLINLSFISSDLIIKNEYIEIIDDRIKLNRLGIEAILKHVLDVSDSSLKKALKKVVGTTIDNTTGYSNKELQLFEHYNYIKNQFKKNGRDISWLNDIDTYNKIAYFLTISPGIIELEKFISREDLVEFEEADYKVFESIKDSRGSKFKYHSLCESVLKKSINDMLKYLMNFSQVSKKMKYDEKIKEYYRHNYTNKKSDIPLLDIRHVDNIISSPQVKKTLRQAIKIINAIILEQKTYPYVISIESTKEMNGNEKRKEIERSQKQREYLRKKAEELLDNKTKKNIEKVMLYEEVNGICPYCGKAMDLDYVVNGINEVEHIIPISISLDNSFDNKTVSCRECNSNKNNRTPYQFLYPRGLFDEFEKRIKTFKLSDKKIENFVMRGDVSKYKRKFFNRNLRDTSYATKEMVNQINLFNIYLEDKTDIRINTLSTPGQLTHALRDKYQMDKDRLEVKHHAVDASLIAAIAGTNIGKEVIEAQNNPKYWLNKKNKDLHYHLKNLELDTIINDIKDESNVYISKQVIKNIQGSFANANIYKIIKKDNEYFKIENIPNIYSIDFSNDANIKKFEDFFKVDGTNTLLCKDNNIKLYNKLKDIFEAYKGEKNNPFVQYVKEINNLSNDEIVDGVNYGIRNSEKAGSPFVKTLRYYSKISDPYFINKKNINKKDKTLIAYDSLQKVCTKVYVDLEKNEFVFFPVLRIYYNNKTKKIDTNNEDYKYMFEKLLNNKKLKFVVDLYNGNLIEVTKKNGTVIKSYYVGYHKTHGKITLKDGYFTKLDKCIKVFDTDILGNEKLRLTYALK